MITQIKRMNFMIRAQPLGNRHPIARGAEQPMKYQQLRTSADAADITGKRNSLSGH